MKKLSVIIFFLTLVLLLIGLIVVLTASSSFSALSKQDSFYYFKKHLVKVIWAIPALLLAAMTPYKFYKYISKYLMIAIVTLLILTFFVAVEKKGASRWLTIFGFEFQPVELAKLVLIIHLAYLLDKKDEYLSDLFKGYLPLMIWILLVSGIILIQPNVSNALLIFVTSMMLIYVGGASTKHVFATALIFISILFSVAMMFPHAQGRIIRYVESISTGGYANIQVKQALVSLGSGGIFGVGVGNSKQNNLFLPEAHVDFIYAILGEQFGLIGALIVLLIYLTLILAGVLIAKRAKDKFGQLLAFGISIQIGIYALVNIAVTTGLFPTTGLPLPFISYGGTSILINSFAIGILMNVAISSYVRELERKKLMTEFETN
jgi:cell division protein FtsW